MTTPTPVEYFNANARGYDRATGGCTREVAVALLDLPELQGMYGPSAMILDNACGTAVIAEEIISRCRKSTPNLQLPQIRAADASAKMIDMAKGKMQSLQAGDSVTVSIMPGEKLTFPDNIFTHSITNMGILFFKDGIAGANEIYRTLKPGGVAIVTSWSDLGYLKGAIHPAQKIVRSDDPPFQLPVDQRWFTESHVKKSLQDGGFKDVQIVERRSHYGASNTTDLADSLMSTFGPMFTNWSDGERSLFQNALIQQLDSLAMDYIMLDGQPGVGVEMKAIVAIGRK